MPITVTVSFYLISVGRWRGSDNFSGSNLECFFCVEWPDFGLVGRCIAVVFVRNQLQPVDIKGFTFVIFYC